MSEIIIDAVCCCEQGCVDLPFTDYTVVEAACTGILNGVLMVNRTCSQNPCATGGCETGGCET
jgi:hypothetical protein